VNVGGLVASTLDISHAGFLAAKNSCGNERRFGPDTCTRLTVRRSRLRASGDVDGRRRLGLTLIAGADRTGHDHGCGSRSSACPSTGALQRLPSSGADTHARA
jgi:hypothetical protein